MDINITFVFGNRNTFTIKMNRVTKVAQLYVLIRNLLGSNILYLVCNCKVLGVDDFKKSLHELDCFMYDTQTLSVVYKHEDAHYSDNDLIVYNYMKYMNTMISNNNITNTNNNRGGIMNMLDNITEDLFSSQIVSISESDYDLYATTVNLTDIDNDTCTVCQEVFDSTDTIDALFCGHSFHQHCIHDLLINSTVQCPVCAYDVRG